MVFLSSFYNFSNAKTYLERGKQDTELQNYEHLGIGHCATGYYKGWTDDADHAIMDAEKCAAHCDKEPECLYFAVNPSNSCSRYNSVAGSCTMISEQNHELYKKKVGKLNIHIAHYYNTSFCNERSVSYSLASFSNF